MATPQTSPLVRATPWVVLTLAAALGACLRYYWMHELAPPGFSYFIESCVRFRYAEMRMLGHTVPPVDPWVQWPEGFPVGTMILSLPDRVAAAYYGLAGGGDTFLASRHLINLLSALAVVAFLPLALTVLKRPGPAAAATIIYAGTFSSFARSFGNYLREDFAFPGLLIVTAAAAAIVAGGDWGTRRSWFYAAVAAAAAFWAAATWHLSQFYFGVLAAMLLLAVTAGRERPAAFASAAVWLGFAAAAVSQTPLWAKGALWGPASALLAAPAVGYAVARLIRRPARTGVVSLATGAALVTAALSLSHGDAYNHVYSLIWAKVTHGGVKPEPAALSPLVRLFWVGPYDSPSPLQTWLDYGPLLIGAILGIAYWCREPSPRRNPNVGAALVPAAIFAALYGLMNRLGIFAAPWLAILNANALTLKKGKTRAAAALVMFGLWGLHLYGIYDYAHPGRYHAVLERVFRPRPATPWYYGAERIRLLSTFAHSLPPGAVLADFSVSPQIMYFGGHAVALNPMFEVPEARRKAWTYVTAATGGEEEFYNLCRQWRVRYVVHFAPQVLARDAGTFYNATGRVVSKNSAAGRMQFAPHTLRRFRLLYETYSVRVFEVGSPYDGYRAAAYHPLFDPARFPDVPTPEELRSFYQDFYRADVFYRQGLGAMARGDAVGAAAAFTSCLRLHPDYEEADLLLGQALLATEQPTAARAALERFARANPDDPRPAILLNQLNLNPPRRRADPYGPETTG